MKETYTAYSGQFSKGGSARQNTLRADNSRIRNLARILMLGLACAAMLQPAQAANKWWQGGAGTANNTGSNWYPSDTVTTATTLATSDVAIFSVGTTFTGAYTISGTPTAAGINVEEGTITIGSTWGAFPGTAGVLTVGSGGTLAISVSTSLPLVAGSTLVLNGGRFRNTNTATTGSFIDVDTTITLGTGGGIISATGGSTAQVILQPTSIISGTGPLTKDGNAILAVAAVCTYSGATIVNDGQLRCRTTSNVFPTATDLTVTSPGIFSLNGVNQRVGSVTGSGNVTLGAATFTVGGSGNPGPLTGAITSTTFGKVTKTGSGTLTLAGANTYNGTLTVSQGNVNVTSSGVLCDATCDVTVNGGSLNLSNATQTIENLTGTGGNVYLGSGHTLTTAAAASGSYMGTINGPGGLTKSDSFNLTLGGSNSYDGITAISGVGTITVSNAAALGTATGKTTVASGAGLNFASGVAYIINEPIDIAGIGNGVASGGAIFVQTAGTAITFSNTITLTADASVGASSAAGTSVAFNGSPAFTNSGSGANLTLNGASGTGTKAINGAIGIGTGGLTKLQSGTWSLTADNPYSGPTTVGAGTLLANNTTGSATGSGTVTVTNGTLGGNGTVGGPVVVTSGANIGAGNSVGLLTLGNGLDLSAGGTNVWELGTTNNATAGVDFDQIVLTGGNLVLGGSSHLVIKFLGANTAPNATNAFWQHVNTWTNILLAGTAANPGTTSFITVDAPASSVGTFSAAADATGNIIVTFTPGAPTANFAAAPLVGYAPLTVNFTNLTTGVGTNFAWDFGDGNTSSAFTPANTYTSAGTYTVSLNVIGPGGSSSFTNVNYIVVTNGIAPTAAFVANITNGLQPLTVTLTNLSTGTAITNYLWDLGDGSTATNVDVVHTYTNAGSYTVKLTATSFLGANTATNIGYIVVTNFLPPVAGFVADVTTGLRPLTVNFTNQTTGLATNYSWSFGDGNTSTNVNPANTYTNAGTYTVILTALGPGGANSATNVGYIVVTNPPPPVVAFTGGPTTGTAPLQVLFTNLTTGATTYFWTFGDGNTSTATNPTNTYASSGSYDVSLQAVGPGGTNTITNVAFVVVTGSTPPPVLSGSIPGAGTTNVQLTFSSVNGASYQVQYVTELTNGPWTTLTNITATGSSTTVTDTTSPAPMQRFYRVIVP